MKKYTRWGFMDKADGDEADRIMIECMFRNKEDAQRARNIGLREGRQLSPIFRVEMTIHVEK